MSDNLKRLAQYILLVFVICFGVITIISSGGGDGDGGDGSNSNDTTTTTSDVMVLDSEIAALEIAEVSINEDDEFSLTTTSYSSLGENLEVGSIVTVVPGVDDRFPIGLAGKVSSATTNPDGSVTATLEKATFSEVFYSVDLETSVALNAENFIGAIIPSATQTTGEAAAAYSRMSDATHEITKQAIDDGVIIRNSTQSYDDIVLGDEGYIPLEFTIPLSDMGIDVSDIDDNAAFVITGSMNNLWLKKKIG